MIKLGVKVDPARLLIRRADAARDEKRYRDAGALYADAVRLAPHRGDIHVQAGHMFKEAGDFELAAQHYQHAMRIMPQDADLALQMGHFYKRTGRLDEATASYKRALALTPGWDLRRRNSPACRKPDGGVVKPATRPPTIRTR